MLAILPKQTIANFKSSDRMIWGSRGQPLLFDRSKVQHRIGLVGKCEQIRLDLDTQRLESLWVKTVRVVRPRADPENAAIERQRHDQPVPIARHLALLD